MVVTSLIAGRVIQKPSRIAIRDNRVESGILLRCVFMVASHFDGYVGNVNSVDCGLRSLVFGGKVRTTCSFIQLHDTSKGLFEVLLIAGVNRIVAILHSLVTGNNQRFGLAIAFLSQK